MKLTEDVIEAQYARVRSQARRLIPHWQDAEDVVQTAMERAWRFRDRFASDAAPGPWLAAITRRAAYDLVRSRTAPSVPIDDTYAADEATETAVLRRESAQSLGTAIAALAPPYRETLVLHDVLGLSSREIASRESLPYHTVRTHLFRARKALRDAYVTGAAA